MPSSTRARETAHLCSRFAGEEDPSTHSVVASFPAKIESPRALRLGLPARWMRRRWWVIVASVLSGPTEQPTPARGASRRSALRAARRASCAHPHAHPSQVRAYWSDFGNNDEVGPLQSRRDAAAALQRQSAFVGAGNMGQGMISNLARAHEVCVNSRTRARAGAWPRWEHGERTSPSPRRLQSRWKVRAPHLCLPNEEAAEAVLLDRRASSRARQLVIRSCATTQPSARSFRHGAFGAQCGRASPRHAQPEPPIASHTHHHHARPPLARCHAAASASGARFIDAPVSGGASSPLPLPGFSRGVRGDSCSLRHPQVRRVPWMVR